MKPKAFKQQVWRLIIRILSPTVIWIFCVGSPWLLTVWAEDRQPGRHQGACWICRTLTPSRVRWIRLLICTLKFRKHCAWEYSDTQKMFTKYLQNWYLIIDFFPRLKSFLPLLSVVYWCVRHLRLQWQKSRRLGGLSNRNLFLTVRVAGSLKSRCQQVAFWRGLFPGLQTVASLCSHTAEKK